MKILITGGAGFIGSHLCDFLIKEGFEVICMDNMITGREENIRQHFGKPEFTFIRHNVSEYIKYEGKIDYILHFASPASPNDYLAHPIHTLKAGSLGTLNTLGLAREKGAKYLLASTSEIYGDPLISPQSEDYWGNVNPTGPRSVYDEAKRFAEAMTLAFRRTHGLDVRIARIFNTYGPRMRRNDGRVVPNLIAQALSGEPLTVYGNGTQTRSFCFIEDMVRGIYKLMLSNVHEPVNLGNPEEVTVLEFARLIKRLTGSNSRIVFKALPEDDPKQRRPDGTKAAAKLNWESEIKLEEGLKRTIHWFQHEKEHHFGTVLN